MSEEQDARDRIIQEFLDERRKGRFWRTVRSFVWLVVILLILYGLFWRGPEAPWQHQPYAASVAIEGLIQVGQSTSPDTIIRSLEKAFEDPRAKGVILRINSPGGGAAASYRIYQRIRALKAEYPDTPVIAVGGQWLASGAYYIALAADKIFVNPNTVTGSIGVIMQSVGIGKFLRQHGIEPRVITAGEHKDRLNLFRDMTEQDRAKLKETVDAVHQEFIQAVRAARGDRLAGKAEALFSGDFWMGRKAVELGLADDLGTLHQVLAQELGVDTYRDYTPSSPLRRFTEQLSQGVRTALGLGSLPEGRPANLAY